MTEDEAKMKWCPMTRSISVDIEDKDSGNRVHGAADPFEHSRCIGSACMMWRWDIDLCRKGPEIDHGYCGLAGKP